MPLKDIVVCLDPTDAGEARLRLAAALACGCGAHLSAAYIAPQAIPGAPASRELPTIPPSGAAWMPQAGLAVERSVPGVAPGIAADVTRGPELADIIEARFREEMRPHALEGDWHMFGAGEGEDLLAILRNADLVVYGQAASDWRLPTGFRPEDVIVGCGRPVLVVPYAGAFATVGGRVLVAWDGTREASRALHDALPLMARGEAVMVMTVVRREAAPDEDRASLDRVIRHLQRHGIAARTEETVRGDVPIADLLLSRAADLGADLLVAGAYHHSQFREALIGGVSRDLLDHMTLPVLMAH
jgi:nucleotide-binding universal stress UspA family protein